MMPVTKQAWGMGRQLEAIWLKKSKVHLLHLS